MDTVDTYLTSRIALGVLMRARNEHLMPFLSIAMGILLMHGSTSAVQSVFTRAYISHNRTYAHGATVACVLCGPSILVVFD